MTQVTRHGPNVTTPQPTVTVTITEHWGHQVGDVRTYKVSRTGDRITVSNNFQPNNWLLSPEVAQHLREALNAVLDWTDDSPERETS